MKRLSIGLWLLALLVAASGREARAARPPLLELLPADTLAVASASDYSRLRDRIGSTAPGRLARDEQVGAFAGALATAVLDFQFPASSFARRHGEASGLAIDWRDLPSGSYGEVVVGLVARPRKEPVLVLLVDAQAHVGLVRGLIEAELARAERLGRPRRSEQIGAGKLLVVPDRFADAPLACAAFRDEVCGWCDDPQVLRHVLLAWEDRNTGRSLPDNPRFARWRERPAAKRGELPFFVDLAALGLAQDAQSTLALGGSVSVAETPADLLVEVELLLDTPRTGPARLLALESAETTAESFIPAEAATYATLHWNVAKAAAEWAKMEESRSPRLNPLSALENAANELELDVPAHLDVLLPHLAGRFSQATWFDEDTSNGKATITAISLRRPGELLPRLRELAERMGSEVSEGMHEGQRYFALGPESRGGTRAALALHGEHLLLVNRTSALHRAIEAAHDPAQRLGETLDYKLVASKGRRLAGDAGASGAVFARPSEFARHLHERVTNQSAREELLFLARTQPFPRILLKTAAEFPPPPLAAIERWLAPAGGVLVDDGDVIRCTLFVMRRKQ
jgi:hypothetical protein